MVFESLESELSLSAGDYISSAEDAQEATAELGETADETQGALDDFNAAGAAAGAGVASAGAAAQEALDSTQAVRTELDQAAISAGISADEMSQLATDVSDAGTPLNETAGMLSTLADRGVESEDKLASLSEEFSQLAQATGTNTPQATQTAIQSMRAFGGEIEDIGEFTDTLTTVTRSTSLDFQEFGEVVGDIQPTIDDLGLSMDDVAARMMALEEQGVNSQRAQELFAQAAESAEGDVSELDDELDISQDELESQQEELANAEGATDEYAAAQEGNISAMDRARQRFSEIKLAAAGLLQPISAIAPALMGVGTAIAGLSTAGVTASGVMATLGTALGVLTGPIGLAIGAVGLLAAAFATDFMGIRTTVMDALGTVKQLFRSVVTTLTQLWDKHGQQLVQSVTQAFNTVKNTISSVLSFIWKNLIRPILQSITKAWDKHGKDITQSATSAFNNIRNIIKTVLTTLWKSIIKPILATLTQVWKTTVDALQTAWDLFGDDILSITRTVFDTIKTVIDTVINNVLEIIDLALDVLSGDWEGAWNSIKNIVDNTLSAIVDILKNAKKAFSEAIDIVIKAVKTAFDFLIGTGEGTLIGSVKGIFGTITTFITDTAVGKVRGAFDSVVEGIKGAFGGIKDWIVGVMSDFAGSIVDKVRDGVNTLISTVNDVLPGSLNVPELGPVGGGSVGTGPLGELPGVPGNVSVPQFGPWGGGSVNVPGLPLPKLDTGGIIEETGIFVGHEGEHIYNPAEADKGNPDPPGGSGTTIVIERVEASSRREGRKAGKALKRELKRFDI